MAALAAAAAVVVAEIFILNHCLFQLPLLSRVSTITKAPSSLSQANASCTAWAECVGSSMEKYMRESIGTATEKDMAS